MPVPSHRARYGDAYELHAGGSAHVKIVAKRSEIRSKLSRMRWAPPESYVKVATRNGKRLILVALRRWKNVGRAVDAVSTHAHVNRRRRAHDVWRHRPQY